MKQNLVASVVAIAALVLCGIGWLVLPWLEGAQRAVDAEAAVHLERARRSLDKYDYGWEYKSLLLDRLAEVGVDVDVEDPDELIDVGADEYQAKHEDLWEIYQPTDWQASPRPRRANYGNLPGQIREGISARAELVDENRARLEQALAAVERALSVSSGDASSRSYAEATRLKGVIRFHMGLAEWLRARVKRLEADPYRSELIALAIKVSESDATRALAADSGIDEQIEMLEARLADAEGRLNQDKEELTRLDATVRNFRTRIAAVQSRASETRKALGELQAGGIDFSDPDGSETFRTRLMEQDKLYRDAMRELRSLEVGSFPHAKIDYTGDYLRGSYVENGSSTDLTVEHGLQHYENGRDVLAAAVHEQEQAMDDFRADIARLENMKAAYVGARDRAIRDAAEAEQAAVDVYAELNRVESEASAMEEDALDLLEQSAQAAARAAKDARQWVSNARELTRGVSREAKQRSALAKRSGDGWMGGYMTAQEAEARIAKAWIYHARYEAHNQNADVLTRVSQLLELEEADPDVERANATDARDAGVEEVTKAIGRLEEAHKAADQPWTIIAQEAGALYLLSMFGEPSYVDDAIQAYENATEGREDKRYAEKFVTRLRRLRSR
ncbi:MAG: coiled-coil domain-containing protein [Planctomycetota bacterium]